MSKSPIGAPPMRVEHWKLKDLKRFERNARSHPPEQIAQLARSLKEFGWTNPLLIDQAGELVAGHGRLLAAEQVAAEGAAIPNWARTDEAPVIVLRHLTAAQRRAYRIADNRLPEGARWDDELLRLEATDLRALGADLALLGLTEADLQPLGDPSAFLASATNGQPQDDSNPERVSSGFVQLAFTVTPVDRKDVLAALRGEQERRKLDTTVAALLAVCRELHP